MVVGQPRRRLRSLRFGIGVGSDVMDLKQQLIRDEGSVRHAYEDSLGFTTIGVGRLIDFRRGGGLRDGEIDFLLGNDIEEKTAQVLAALPWASKLSETRRAVLINMAFQLGINGLLKFKRALGSIEDGQYSEAAMHMLDSLWAQQTPERAKRLAKQMTTGEWV
jgi:lysozyme